MKKKRLIPFKLLPASWGLSGRTRAIAEAEYYYDGIDLEKKLAEIYSESEKEKDLRVLEIDYNNEQITEQEYYKKKAEINNEPYVTVLKMDINEDDPKSGFVELDWNEEFVKFLHDNGYVGKDDSEMVNKWFNDLCRTILLQESQDQDFGLSRVSNPDVEIINVPREDKG